ncbi:MAG TPA: hypothetical protein VII06_05415 [Chloroflexota bacterium]|jgi:nitrite reductase/ring-hydroxylating ferredoxin subunit
MAAAERTLLLRRAGWTSLLALLALATASTLAFLWPPAAKVQAGPLTAVERIDYRTGAQAATEARLVQQGSEWVGAVPDFPPGTLTHFQLRTTRGFFLARLADGSWRAFADHSTYRGLPVKWRLWSSPGINNRGERTIGALCGLEYGDCFDEEGWQVEGPAPQPLVEFPVRIENDQVYVSVQPRCAAEPPHDRRWWPMRSRMPSLNWWIC